MLENNLMASALWCPVQLSASGLVIAAEKMSSKSFLLRFFPWLVIVATARACLFNNFLFILIGLNSYSGVITAKHYTA